MQFGILHSRLTLQPEVAGGFPAEGKQDPNGEASNVTLGGFIQNFYGRI